MTRSPSPIRLKGPIESDRWQSELVLAHEQPVRSEVGRREGRPTKNAGRPALLAGIWGLLALTFGFASPLAAAFVPAMAKRQAPGPFAAAPIVQGGWADGSPSDTLVFASGTQISGTFYQTLDASQGSLVVWITPEWNGNDGKRHDFFNNDSGTDPGAISLRAAAGSLVFRVGGSAAEEVSANISGWVAGARHCIVARWDNDNGLSGANRLGLSVDDVHTFAPQATPPAAIGAQNYVGSDRNGLHPANAIIEGLTLYRRPLFDGTNGIDAGNGDEINLIYNAGPGRDPASLTGSWDVVLALPTNSTTGALATGTGQAWTHPHLLNLIPGNTNRGGFMLAGAAATDGWSNEGAPTSVLPLATVETVFAGGYKVASNAANQGIYQDVTVAAGADSVARAIVHSDGTCLPRLILFDQIGGAEIGHLDGTTTSTRTAPNVLVLTGEAPAGSTTLRVKLVNTVAAGTCYWHQAEVLANSVNNPSMERWQGTTPDLPVGWVDNGVDPGSTPRTANAHSGSYAFEFNTPTSANRATYNLGVGANGDFYTIGLFSYYVSGEALLEWIGGFTGWYLQSTASTMYELFPQSNPNTWKHRVGVGRRANPAGTDPNLYAGQFYSAGDFIIDDFYAFPLTPVSLTATAASAANSVENGEVRVDGRDVNLQANTPGLGTTSGTFTVGWRPRHSAANAVAFREGTTSQGAYILSLYGDATSYINVYWDNPNSIVMQYGMGGSSSGSNCDASAIVAGTKYTLEVAYTGGGNMTLKIDGVTCVQFNAIPAAFGTAPTSVYRGSRSNGDRQGDATFSYMGTAVRLLSFTAAGLDSAVGLSWETASELDNLGFHLYRAASENGPWTRITPFLIPGLGSSPEGKRYSFVDAGLVNGATYLYRLEDVDRSGEMTSHGPVSATPQADGGRSTSPPPPPVSSPASDKTSPTAWKAYGDPSKSSFRVLSRTSSSVTVELDTGGFYALAQPDGSFRLFVPGFFELSEPGLPSLPTRRAWLEAVAGRGVRLDSIRVSDVVAFSSLRPTAAGLPEMGVGQDGTIHARFRSRKPGRAFRRAGLVPTEPAQILETGFQGETKKAEIELAPLRWDPSSQRLLLARRMLVRVVFAGIEPDETSLGGSRGHKRRERPSFASSGVLAWLTAHDSGLYAVRFEDVFPFQRKGIPSSQLRLNYQGRAVGFHIEPNSSSFGPGSVLYFLSEGASLDPYGDAVYSLEKASGGVQMPAESATPSGSLTAYSFQHAQWEVNRLYQGGLLEASDLWMWDGFITSLTKTFTIDHLASSQEPARLTVFLQGASDFEASPDHHVRASVNGVAVGEATWDGKTPKTLVADVSPGILLEGDNTLSLENVPDVQAAYSLVYLDRFTLDYTRQTVASSGRFEGRFGFGGQAQVQGLDASTRLLDTTAETPRWLTGAQVSSSGVAFRAEAGRSYLAVSELALLHPQVRLPLSSSLKSTRNQADYILIGPRDFLPAAQPLLDVRRSQGLHVMAVAVEEVYDAFGFGEPRPEAIKDFLAYAFHDWQAPAPRYVLLLGDATYDPKNFMGTGVTNRVPPLMVKTSFMWTVSDPTLAAVNGNDSLPDLAIGRLPAASLDEAKLMVDKIVAFEKAGRSLLAGPDVLVADNPDLAGNFEADAQDIAETFFAGKPLEEIFLSQQGAATRSAILAAFNGGASLVSYIGHGSTAVWASENVFNSWDVPNLLAQPQQPFLMTLNCLNGYFLPPQFNSLAEALLKADGKGAIATFSPSGLSLNDAAHLYHKALLQEILSGKHDRIGDALLAAQADYATTGAFPESLAIYHLIGDPALKLR